MKKNRICVSSFWGRIFLLVVLNPLIPLVFADNPNSALLEAINYDKLLESEPELSAEGVNYGIIARSLTYSGGIPQNDYKPDTNLDYLKNARINCFDYASPAPSNSPHSTDICSILLAADERNSYTGLTPQATADVYEFWYFLGQNIFPQTPPDSEIITASFGSPVADWWTRGFQAMSQHHNKIIIAAIGNGGTNSQLPLYPGAGSNAIGVGTVSSTNTDSNSAGGFNLALPEYTTAGPASNNTCKPDIVAPSNFRIPPANDANEFRETRDFSSFSVPPVSAAAALLISKSENEPALQNAFRKPSGNSLMKAVLLNSARKLPYWHKGKLTPEDDHIVPLDYLQGAGMLDVYSAYRHLIAGRSQPGDVPNTGWDKNSITRNAPAAEKIYTIDVNDPNEKFITVTLCWNSHYQKDFPFEALPEKDTDLLLEIWAADANAPEDYRLIDYSDSPNDNTEHIFCKLDPNYTRYDIIIARNPYSESNTPPDEQDFALAWNISKPDIGPNENWYDLNCDGEINKQDVESLMENLVKSEAETENPGYLLGDINGNHKIDIEDLQKFTEKILPVDTSPNSSVKQ